MGVSRPRPGDWKHYNKGWSDPRTMDPESARRLASGFWKHDHDLCNQIDTWTCDKRKLHEAVQQIMMNPHSFQQFTMDPTRFLDARFGEGTGEAYRHSGQDRVSMRFDPFTKERQQDMATYWGGNTGTTTGTTTNTITTASDSSMYWIRDEVKKQVKHAAKQFVPKKPSINRLVRLPFKVETGGDLLSSLQREFDKWASPSMRLLHG